VVNQSVAVYASTVMLTDTDCYQNQFAFTYKVQSECLLQSSARAVPHTERTAHDVVEQSAARIPAVARQRVVVERCRCLVPRGGARNGCSVTKRTKQKLRWVADGLASQTAPMNGRSESPKKTILGAVCVQRPLHK
jgi:hypothetical protein